MNKQITKKRSLQYFIIVQFWMGCFFQHKRIVLHCSQRFSRQRSGADIKIQDPLPGKADRVITITGNPEQIQYGQFLMQQRLVGL